MSSRDLYDLHPIVRAKATAHLMACEAEGIDLLVTSTYRSIAEQDADPEAPEVKEDPCPT